MANGQSSGYSPPSLDQMDWSTRFLSTYLPGYYANKFPQQRIPSPGSPGAMEYQLSMPANAWTAGEWQTGPNVNNMGGSSYGGGGSFSMPGASRTVNPNLLGQRQVSTWTPVGPAPELGPAPEMNIPEYSEKKVRKLTQKLAAPKIRKLRQAVQIAAGQRYDNPNVKRMTLREALQGYGTGLESAISGSHRGAVAEYGQQRAEQMAKAQAEYQAAVNARMAKYQAAWQKYLRSGKQVSSSGPSMVGSGFAEDVRSGKYVGAPDYSKVGLGTGPWGSSYNKYYNRLY